VGAAHHTAIVRTDCSDESLSDEVIVQGVWWAQLVCCTAGSRPRVEGLVNIIFLAGIGPISSDLIAPRTDTGINGLVGGSASFQT
jgi:hypothetical protein